MDDSCFELMIYVLCHQLKEEQCYVKSECVLIFSKFQEEAQEPEKEVELFSGKRTPQNKTSSLFFSLKD